MENEKNSTVAWVIRGVIIFFVLIFLLSCFTIVSAGERGVRVRLGAVVGSFEPGLHFKTPFIETVHKISVKTQTINYDKNGNEGDAADTSQLFGASKDLQDVQIGVVINYHISPEKVEEIYAQYRSLNNYEMNVLEPIVRAVVKSTTAQYTAEELVTKRVEVSEKASSVLSEQFLAKNSIIETSSITNFEFSKAFTEAIEAKVTAVQKAEAAKNKLEQIKYEAQQTIETAKATAEAQRIQAQSLAAAGGSDYVQLKALDKWDGHLPTQMIPGSSVPFINLKN